MDSYAKIVKNEGKWSFDSYKIVKVLPRNGRIAFQRKGGKYMRGLSISKDAFLKMEDITIIPDMRLELEPNVWLINYGNRIHLVKYCLTKDEKRCDGGFFYFTPKEWIYFWNELRRKIIDHCNM